MDRRQFVTSLGALTIPAVGTAEALAAPLSPVAERSRISLHGRWTRHVNQVLVDHVEVPVSLPLSGCYTLSRTVLLPKLSTQQRAFLHFEAVNYHGRVLMNGIEVGVTLPYVPADFEMTPHVREGTNTIAVVVTDLGTDPKGAGADEVWFGTTGVWEGSGGIIRDTWLEIRPAAFVENVRLVTQFTPEYSAATCHVTTWISATAAGAGPGRCELALLQGDTVIAHAEHEVNIAAGTAPAEVTFSVAHPMLWSPETPNLYTLRVTLYSPVGTDAWTTRTGFRDTTIRGRSFLLNGKPVLLNGVCRYDVWKEQGMTLTRAQMAQDLRAIKALGANFVRLVNYPHDRHIIELADEMGLLVSEEPGYYAVDFHKLSATRSDLGLRVLEHVVRRDWNSPSVFAWMLDDSSEVTQDYVRTGKARVRALDLQGRFIGLANGNTKTELKELCNKTGMDFYGYNASVYDEESYGAIAADFSEKPVIFTSWTGVVPGQTDYVMQKVVDQLVAATKRGVLAGHCFSSWQDLRQFSRLSADNDGGVLHSGVVTEGREPRPLLFQELARLFNQQSQPGSPYYDSPARGPVMEPLRRVPWSPQARITPVDLTSVIATDGGAKLESKIEEKFVKWDPQAMEILGVRIPVPLVNGAARPVVLLPDVADVDIPIHQHCTHLHFLGQIQWGGGFPCQGRPGEEVAAYQLRYQNGKTREIPLRTGIEVVAANTIYVSSRINPVATATQRAFWYYTHWENEHYHALLFSLPIDPGVIESVRCRVKKDQLPLLLFAVLAESV